MRDTYQCCSSLILLAILFVTLVWILEKKIYIEMIRKWFPDFIRRRELRSFDPDWVLKELLTSHRQEFTYWEISKVLADCVPHDKEVWGSGPFHFYWFWVVELRQYKEKPFAYVAGFFDPNLWEPLTVLKSWLFRTPEEAAKCALREMKLHNTITPYKKLFDFLMLQIKEGKMIREDLF